MPAKAFKPSLSSTGMGAKDTPGIAYLRPRRAQQDPLPRSLDDWEDPTWSERLQQVLRSSRLIDVLYLVGVAAVLGLAAYILAYG